MGGRPERPPAYAGRPSAVKYRPADFVPQALIVQDKLADRIRKLAALPVTLAPAGIPALTRGGSRASSLDRVGRCAEFMRGDMGDDRRLTGRKCGMARRSAKHPGGGHRVTARGAGLEHADLAARPGPGLLNRPARARVQGLRRFEERQDVLRAQGSPQGQQVMICIREPPAAAEGDETRVTYFGENHPAPFINARRAA